MILRDDPTQSDSDQTEQSTVQRTLGRGRYLLRHQLGVGGMGVVHLGFDRNVNRPVAIKQMAPHLKDDPEYRDRFKKEAYRASKLSDPNIAFVLDFFDENNELYIVMEFIEGRTLRESLKDRMELPAFLTFAKKCAEGLAAAHEQLIIHSDIKPENIMLSESQFPKLLDFGVAKLKPGSIGEYETSRVTGKSMVGGTPAYMAPEVFATGNVDQQSDIYSLGVVFYETLSGSNPFRSSDYAEIWNRVVNLHPPSLRRYHKRIPSTLDDLILRMMSKNREERPANAGEIKKELETATREMERAAEKTRTLKTLTKVTAISTLSIALLASVIFTVPPVRNTLARWFGFGPQLPTQMQLAVLPLSLGPVGQEMSVYADGLIPELFLRLRTLDFFSSALEVIREDEK